MTWLTDLQESLRWSNSLRLELFKSKHLTYLGTIAGLVTVVVGVVLFIVDPNIRSPIDGIWSAWVTMTHVGFGDVVPVSFLGRLLAAALILVGLVLFSLFTAVVSVALIGKNLDAIGGSMKLIEFKGSQQTDREQEILTELSRLHQRLDSLEALVADKIEGK